VDDVATRVTVTVQVAEDAPERELNVAGLSTARTPVTQPASVAGTCAPVQGSTTPVTEVPPICQRE
jgi:hypothetical protein